VVLAAIGIIAMAWLRPGPRDGPKEGQVAVVCRNTNVRVAIRRGSEVVATVSPSTNSEVTLPPGEYELQVVGGAPELRELTGKLSLGQGERKIIDVRREGIFVEDASSFRPPPPRDGPPDRPPPDRPRRDRPPPDRPRRDRPPPDKPRHDGPPDRPHPDRPPPDREPW